MNTFTSKGYGRIYVDKNENIEKVKNIIGSIDEYEFVNYLPSKLIAPFSEFPKLEYTHKFDCINLDYLTGECFKQGIYIFCLDNGHNEYFDNNKTING